VADGRMKGRVKGLLAGQHPDTDPGAQADPLHAGHMPAQMAPPGYALIPSQRPPSGGMADADAERQALQVLMLARRTADEHVASANRQAEAIRAEARTVAEQIAREAQDAAERARRDGDRALSEAQTRAAQIVHDAQAAANDLRGEAERERAEARSSAGQMVEAAKARAAELERSADEQYEAAIGRLAVERDALQQQIEALRHFDQEYRTRLRVFMHGQLRALGEGEPAVGDIPAPDTLPPTGRPERS
jgi:hypothetical protein